MVCSVVVLGCFNAPLPKTVQNRLLVIRPKTIIVFNILHERWERMGI